MTGHSHTMGAIPARGATTITRRKPAIPAIIAPSNKAPAHTKAICAGVPAAFQKGFQKDSSKASNPGPPQYQTGWKAKVCWFLVAHTTNQQVECDVIMEQWTHKPPQDHQVAVGCSPSWSQPEGCQFGGMATWQLCFHILAPCRFCLATCANITFPPLPLSGMPEIHTWPA